MKPLPLRAFVAALVTLACSLALVTNARAAWDPFSIANGVTVENTAPSGGQLPGDDPNTAGAHPDQSLTIDFGNHGPNPPVQVDEIPATPTELRIHFGAGIVGYVNNVPTCSAEDWGDDTSVPACDVSSQVGETSTTATSYLESGDGFFPLAPGPLPGKLFKIEPRGGAAAELGMYEPETPIGIPAIKLVVPITVDPHDLGLTATLRLPTEIMFPPAVPGGDPQPVAIHVDELTQTLFGFADGKPFWTNPTTCRDAAITVTATSLAGDVSTGSAGYMPRDCDHEPFSAQLTTTADPATADSTAAISFDLQPSGDTDTRVASHVKSTTVIAPPGTLLNPALAANLDACTDVQFAKDDTAVEASCPSSSEVGSIEFVSPILGPFPGKVYFGTQTSSDRLRLFLDVPLLGAHIKLSASVNPDLTTGQVTTVFSDLPQIAFTDFRLTFRGGPQSALVTPTTCGENVSQAIVGPWSGGAEVRPQGSFITTDCNRAFTPTLGTAIANRQAGASTGFTLSFDRPDRTVPVGRVAFSLPPGLLGSLTVPGMTQCSLAVAATGGCPDTSKVGDVQAVVGSGSQPPTLNGSAYLTEPKQAGDIAGLSVVVPAKLGPVDAGTVIVGERLVLNSDGHLDVISDPIPALQLGIPLAIRRLTVNINRDGFMRNPTSCGSKEAHGTFSPLDGGADASAPSAIDVDGCDKLAFGPTISAKITGSSSLKRNAHPPLSITIRQGDGQAAMKSAVVTLPRSLATNVPTLSNACDPAVLAQGKCPEESHIGSATAVSPLISQPLAGPVYLVRVGTGLPKLVVQLRGQASIDLNGPFSINSANQIVSTFDSIPDITLSSFTLTFRDTNGPLTTVGDLCTTHTLAASFTGQNGASATARPQVAVEGCKAGGSSRGRGGNGNRIGSIAPTATKPGARGGLRMRRGVASLSTTVMAPRGKRLATVKLTLPKGLTLKRAHITAKAAGKRLAKRAVKAKGRVITLKLPKRGAPSVAVSVRGIHAGSSKLASRLAKRRGTAWLVIQTTLTNHAHKQLKLKLKLR